MNDEVSDGFDNAASTWGKKGPTYWNKYGEKLVELINIFEGASVLDVGTGRGACLFPAYAKTGETGRIIGIDASKEMVNETQADIKKKGITSVEILQMNAATMNFPGEKFDFVLCGFGIPFFNIGDIIRVLKRKGKAGFSFFCQQDDDLSILFNKHLAPHLMNPDKKKPVNQEQINIPINTPEGMKKYLESLGFSHISVTIEQDSFFYHSKEEWWEEMEWWRELWPSPMRERFKQLGKENPLVLESFHNEAFDLLRNFKTNNGYLVKRSVMYSIAEK
jgi:ubiquinone/menaquinone biosynthesis C-methylase UbiE